MMNNIGVTFTKILDPLIIGLFSYLFLTKWQTFIKKYNFRFLKKKYNKINIFLIIIFIPFFLIYDYFLRHVSTTSFLGKFISLFQNWYPGRQLFMDGMWQGRQFKCSLIYDIYSDQQCIPGKYNYPALYKFLPTWFGSNLFIYALVVIVSMIIMIIYLNKVITIPSSLVFIFLFSPATLFLLDRANFESISAITLLIASIYSYHLNLVSEKSIRNRYLILTSICFFIFICTKFFGILLAIPLIIASKFIIRIYWLVFSTIMFSFTVFVLEFKKGIANAPTPSASSLGLLSAIHNFRDLSINIFIYSLFFIILARNYLINLIKIAWVKGITLDINSKDNMMLPVLTVFVSCWILTENVFYRAVLIAPYLIYKACVSDLGYYTFILLGISYLSAFPFTSNFACMLLFIECFGIYKSSMTFRKKVG